MVNAVEAFSYNIEEKLEIINKAKMMAKRNDQSFSQYVLEALEEKVTEKKGKAPMNDQIPILGSYPFNEELTTSKQYTQETLLSFMENTPKETFNEEIAKIHDPRKIKFYRDYGRCIMTVSQTKLRKMIKA